MAARTRVMKRKPRFQGRRSFKRQRTTPTGISTTNVPTGKKAVAQKSMTARLIYSEVLTNVAAGGLTDFVYSCNGLFDPRDAIGGVQPTGFDQYMAFYDHFHVTSSKMIVKILPKGGSAKANDLICGVAITDDAVALSGVGNIIMNGNSSWDITGPAGANGHNLVLQSNYRQSEFFGGRTGDAFVGSDAADPSEEAFYHIWMGNPLGTTPDAGNDFVVEIIYDVTFSERKTTLGS